jgi:uncharacterized membrane protein
MIIIIGLVVLIVAVVLALAGIGTNMNGAHPLTGDFSIFGQHLSNTSTGQLFLFGIIIGITAVLGLIILYAAFVRRRSSRRLQKELKDSRGETVALRIDHDRLSQQLDDERTARLKEDAAKELNTQNSPPLDQ